MTRAGVQSWTARLAAWLFEPRGAGRALPGRHDPDRQRALQRQAARAAFLSEQLPGQRVLFANPQLGDVH